VSEQEIQQEAEKDVSETWKVYEQRPNYKALVRTWIAGYKKAQEEYQADAERWNSLIQQVDQIRRPLANAESYHLSVGELVVNLVDDYWEKERETNK